jgi:hypothetical protein
MMLDSGCLMLADEKPHAAIQHPVSSLLSHFRQNAFVQKNSPFLLLDNEVRYKR